MVKSLVQKYIVALHYGSRLQLEISTVVVHNCAVLFITVSYTSISGAKDQASQSQLAVKYSYAWLQIIIGLHLCV